MGDARLCRLYQRYCHHCSKQYGTIHHPAQDQLAIGTYSETITVTDSNGASASLTASFTVCAIPATDDTSPIKETPENTAPTNDNQALPQTSDNNFLFMTVLCLISLVSLISGLIALRNLKRVK